MPARAAVEVVVVTTRDDFLLEFGVALGGQASITPVESVALALEGLSDTRRPQILAIDARDLGDPRADVDTVIARAPHVSVLIFVPEGSEKEAATSFKGSSIFAVLSLPLDQRETAAAFTGAVAECKTKLTSNQSFAPSRRGAPVTPEHPSATPEGFAPLRAAASDDGAGRDRRPLIAGGIVLAAIAAGAVWYLSQDKAPASAKPVSAPAATQAAGSAAEIPVPAVETSLVQGKVDELLEKARQAMRERRYAEPTGDNALLFYRSALGAEPGNGEAVDGLGRVTSVLAGRFDEALAANRYEEAATTLAQLRNATPDDQRLAEFQQRLTTAQVSKALADQNPERAAALLRTVQGSNAIPAAQLAKWRADITRLQEQSSQKREAEQAARDAAATEQKKARDARAAAAAEAEQQAQATRAQQVAQEKLRAEQAAKLAQEATGSRSAAQTAPDARSLQSRLKRKRYVAPEFPQEALSRKVGGLVTVAFTVDIEGVTRDVRVESSDPPRIFDRAAIAAVKRWRYEPLLLEGVPTEVPARMAIRFAPQE